MSEEKELTEENLSEMLQVRRDKIKTYDEMGVKPFGHRFDVTHHAKDVKEEFANLEGEEEQGEVSLAGRLMAIRGHGKASFASISDKTGSIQV